MKHWWAAATLATMIVARLSAQDAPPAPAADAQPLIDPVNPVRGDEITPAMTDAVAKGLDYLARIQQADGSFGQNSMSKTASASLAGIAFMSSGNLPGRGKYGANVQKAVDYVVNNAAESGLLSREGDGSVMYAHGFAALFLAEVYGMTQDDLVKEKLQRAIRLIEKTQNVEGGWRYTPSPQDADISVTICQVMALRAARDAGIKVEKTVIDKAVAYVRKCQNDDGGFRYQAMGGSSEFPRSAAGVAALYYMGIYEGDEIAKGLKYVQRSQPKGGGNRGGAGGHYFYGHYYAVQVMFLAGGDAWAKWFPAIRDELIARQNKQNGGWTGEMSEDYCTAMALIILQMPNRYLPVFSGKGPGS